LVYPLVYLREDTVMVDVFRPVINGRRSTYYYGKVRDPKTKNWKKVSLEVTDKGVARQKLHALQRRTEQAAYGLINPVGEMPLLEHLDRLDLHLAQKGRGEAYRLQTFREIAKVVLYCAGLPVPKRIEKVHIEGVRAQLARVSLDVITADKVDEFLGTLPAERAARTRNGFRTSVITLFSFLVEKKKLTYNPMLVVTRHEGEEKRKRRALPPDQLQKLLDAAKARPLANTLMITRGERRGQPEAAVTPEVRALRERDGQRRALIYLTAVYTGFRRNELRSLRVKHLRFGGEVPAVHLPGEFTKNGKDADIPLPADFANQLRTWVAGAKADDPVFAIPKHDELLKALKKDLAFAGIPYRDELGRVFDFHSLRKCLGSYLRRAKVDPAVSKMYLRHGDIRLTMQTYDDEQLHDLHAEATTKLPRFSV
jgi:integrase